MAFFTDENDAEQDGFLGGSQAPSGSSKMKKVAAGVCLAVVLLACVIGAVAYRKESSGSASPLGEADHAILSHNHHGTPSPGNFWSKQSSWQNKIDDKQKGLQSEVDTREEHINNLFQQSETLTEEETKVVEKLNEYRGQLAKAAKGSSEAVSIQSKLVAAQRRKGVLSEHREKLGTELREAELNYMVDTFGNMKLKFDKMMHMEARRLHVVQAYMNLARAEGKALEVLELEAVKKLLFESGMAQEVFREQLDTRIKAYEKALNTMHSMVHGDAQEDTASADAMTTGNP